jgi:hypothetical protein
MWEYRVQQDEKVTVSGYRRDRWWVVFYGNKEYGFDAIASFREEEDADNFVKEKEKRL